MNNSFRLISVFLAVSAMIQLFGIAERIHHALWQWYKFSGYTNDGHTTLDETMVIATFGLSLCAIFIAWLVCRYSTKQSWAAEVAMYSAFSLCLGLALLSAILISPLAQMVQR